MKASRGFAEALAEVNVHLQEWEKNYPERSRLRELLVEAAGSLERIPVMVPEEARKWLAGRDVAAVDGSCGGYGTSYPFYIYLLRSLARTSDGGRTVREEVITPLLERDRQRVLEIAGRENLSPEQALGRLKDCALAELEVGLAQEALAGKPRLLVLDGGFLRCEKACPERWEEFRRQVLSSSTLVVGVIEEVGTFDIARLVRDLVPGEAGWAHDREMLFGTLCPGEWLRVKTELEFKKSYYTCFIRPGSHPQAVAYDFFREQLEEVPKVVEFLAALTPAAGRGIPFLLDMVDEEVKVSPADVELFLSAYLDQGIKEKYFRPHRERRGL